MLLFTLLACSSLFAPAPAPPAPVAAPPAAPSTVQLTGHVTVVDGRLTVFNDSADEWDNVIATPNDTLVCNLGIVHPHDQAGMSLANCSAGPLAAPVVSVRVVAQQGYFVAVVPPDAGAPVATAAAPHASAPTAAASATAPAEAPKLKASASMSGGFGPARRITVRNLNDFTWTGCTVTINSLYSYTMKNVAGGADEGIMLVRFKDAAGNVFTSNNQIKDARVRCAQGTTSVSPT